HSATRSQPYAVKYGHIRFLSCPGRAETVYKFRAISGSAWKMHSLTPPKSAKVKLRRTRCLMSRHCAIGKHGQFGLNGHVPWEENSGERSAHWNLGLQQRNLTLSVPSHK